MIFPVVVELERVPVAIPTIDFHSNSGGFFYLEVKKVRPSCSAKINSARHNLLDLKERGSKNKNPMDEVHWVWGD